MTHQRWPLTSNVPLIALLPGMFAGAVQTMISTPVDLLKIRQQLQLVPPGSPRYVGPLQLLQHILSTEGLPGDHTVAGFYRGACTHFRATALNMHPLT